MRSSNKVGLVRYSKEDWNRWRETVDDRELFESSWESWVRTAEARAERLRRARLEVIWVDAEPDAMAEWCRARGYRNDSERRHQYAAEQIGNIRVH